jgi:hypothetical protein
MSQQSQTFSGEMAMPATKTVMLIVATLIVLTIIIIAVALWRRYHAKPNCAQYSGDARSICSEMAAGCKGKAPCLNAVAQCMPVMSAVNKETTATGKFIALVKDIPQLASCSAALSNMNPAAMANHLKGSASTSCIPPQLSPYLKSFNPAKSGEMYVRDLAAIKDVADAVAPAIPWAVRVAKNLPTCPPTTP